MTIIEHLTELRKRLIISVIAVTVASSVGWVFFDRIFGLFVDPYCDTLRNLPERIRPFTGTRCGLIYTGVPDAFLIRFKIAFFTGFAIALPIVLFELWRFVTPGLTQRERRLAIPFVLSSLVLFALGGFFGFLTLEKGLQFLLGFGGKTLTPLFTVDRYVGFLLLLIMAFGLSFEFPLVLIFLAGARVITTAQLRKQRRLAYFLIAVAAAVITPSQDWYTMTAMMVPLILFYEISILVARAFGR